MIYTFIEEELDKLYPNVGCELEYDNDVFHLLIAVMLSAQTTDKKVNVVTKVLFGKYKTIDDLIVADVNDIEIILRPLGISKIKAKRVKDIAKEIKNKYDGVVPAKKEELVTLPGVGTKTANVVRVEFFKIPEFPVDTHVHRVAKKLAIVDSNASVEETEKKLRSVFKECNYGKLHHQFIHFGRYTCKAIKPSCNTCPFRTICIDPK